MMSTLNSSENKNSRRKKTTHILASWRDFPSAVPNVLPTASPFKNTSQAASSSSSRRDFKIDQSCPTGWPTLDGMFNGLGIPSYAVVEITGGIYNAFASSSMKIPPDVFDGLTYIIVGAAGSGKTQVCLSSAVCAAWCGRTVLYIDCSNGFTLQRIEQLIALRAQSSSINSDTSESDIRALQQARTDTLNRITVQTSYDPWELLDVLTTASEPYSADHSFGPFGDEKTPPYLNKPGVPKYDLILIDGLHALFSPYFGIHAFDSRSVSVIGGSSGVGTGTGTGAGALTRIGTVTGTGIGVKGVGVLGKTVIIDPLISGLGVILKALGSEGTAVMVTNRTPQTGTGPQRPGTSIALSDIFDIIFTLSSRSIDSLVSTGARIGSKGLDAVITAELVIRPPYYNANPTSCQILTSELCAVPLYGSGPGSGSGPVFLPP